MKSFKNIILYIYLLLIANISYCQFPHCDTLIHSNKYLINIDSGIRYLKDYVAYKYPEKVDFVENRSNLYNIPLLINDNKKIIFYDLDKIVDCRINISNKHIEVEQYFYPIDGDSLTTIIDKQIAPYGITVQDRAVRYIQSISVQHINAPSISFSDLYNPNTCETFLSIKPINVFLSDCGNYIYIYIFGMVRNDYYASPTSFSLSYMAKLIFSRDGHYIDRIVLRGDILVLFGFHDCPNFIGF